MPAERLDSTVAVVTGASSGIGRATARELADAGAAVVVVARRRDRLMLLANEIAAAGGRACAVEADITVRAEAEAVITKTLSEFGRVDTVVNSAGVMLNGASLDVTIEDWERMIDLNLKGVLYLTRAALPHLLDAARTGSRGVADVVNISSTAGRVAVAGAAGYNATKFAINAATESWRQEFTRDNVRFSLVEPGAVDTELFDVLAPPVRQRYDRAFAKIEKLHAADVARTISFIVTSPRRVSVSEVLVRPTGQM